MSYTLTLAGLAVATMVAIATPGPAFLMASRAAVRSRRLGVATGLGIALSATLWAVAAIFGVAVLMTRFSAIYGAVQLAGGVYLIWLGLSAWRDSSHAGGSAPTPSGGAAARPWRAFAAGFSLTLMNPKVVIFYGSVFVALLPATAPTWVRIAAFAIVVAEEVGWYLIVACIFSQPRVQAFYQRIRHTLDHVMGAVFVALGARIVALARF